MIATARSPSEDRALLRTFAAVGALALAARGAFVAREMLVAARLGAGDPVDALIMAFSVPLFLGLTLGWAMGQAFLPVYARARAEHGEPRARALLAAATKWALALLLAVGVVLWVSSPLLLRLLAAGFPPAKRELTRALLLPLCTLPALSACASIWGAALAARGQQMLVAGALVVMPILELVALAWVPGTNVQTLAWLRPIGSLLELAVLGAALLPAQRGLRDPDASRELLPAAAQLGALTLASAVGALSVLVDQVMTAPLGAGAIAALGYGSKVGLGVLGLFDTALVGVVYPLLARLAAARDFSALRIATRRWALGTFVASALGTALLVAISGPLVRLLFERGAFSPADTALVTSVQVCFVLQIPFHAAALVGTRLLTALSRSHDLVLVSVVSVVVNAFGNLILGRLLGVRGIALATSLVFVVSAAITWRLVSRALARAN